MLVLSRRIGESIQIASDVEITVTEVRGGRVRLAINAPRDVSIHRKEVFVDLPDAGTEQGLCSSHS